jgi:hypothetical protein
MYRWWEDVRREGEEEVVVVGEVAAGVEVLQKFVAMPVPKTESRFQMLVGRTQGLAHLGLVVHTGHSPVRVKSSGTQPEITQNHTSCFVMLY